MDNFQTDSMQMIRSLANASSTFSNPYTGFGTERDPLSQTGISQTAELTDIELSVLYEQNHLIQKIAYLFPLEGAQNWMRFTVGSQRRYGSYGMADSDLQGYLNSRVDREEDSFAELSTGSLSQLFFEASFNARVFGSSYLLLGVEDGRGWDEPIDAEMIKSLRWIEPLYHHELRPNWQGWGNYSRCRHYQYNRSLMGDREIDEELKTLTLIHRSRVLAFNGVYLPEMSLRRRGGRPLSVLQGVWRALARAQQSMDASSYLLQTSSMFTYGLKGLSQIKDAEMRKTIEARFLSIMMSLSILKGIPHDAEQEEIGFATRQFAGIKDLLDIVLDQVAMECDIPRYKLFEVSAQGGLNNGNKGESERFLWSQTLDAWKVRAWKDHLLYLGKIAALAKDSPTKGRSLKDLGVDVPSSLQFSPQEELEMRKNHLEAMRMAKDIGSLDAYEIRMSTYGAAAWSFEVSLDDRVTERLEQMLEQPDQSAIGGTLPADPTVDPNADPTADPNAAAQPGGADLTNLPQFDRADAEPGSDRTEISDPQVLAILLDLLDDQATGVRQVFNVTLDGEDTFRGNATQPTSAGPQYLSWKITPDQIAYRLATTQQGDSISERLDAPGVASKKSGKKLNCKPGNVQCGGKCQGGSLNCFANMTPEQKQKAKQAVGQAKKSGGGSGGGAAKATTPKATTPKATTPKAATPKATTKKSGGGTVKPEPATTAKKSPEDAKAEVLARVINRGKTGVLPVDLQEELGRIKTLPLADREKLRADYVKLKDDFSKNPSGANRDVASKLSAVAKQLMDASNEDEKTNAVMQKVRDHLLNSSRINKADATKLASKISIQEGTFKTQKEKDEFISHAAEFYQLTNGKGDVRAIERTDPRAFADKERKSVNVGDNASKGIVFHEFAHHIEFADERIGLIANKWIESRATGPLEQLKTITKSNSYRDNEFAYPDTFISPYIGKRYDGKISEVLSMGIEHFESPQAMSRLYRTDPEHFNLVLGILAQ